MNSTCPRCNAIIDPNSRFCTSCGAVLSAPGPYPSAGQSAQPGGQIPPWASANPGAASYQQGPSYQQQWSGQQANAQTGGSLGFGGQNDSLEKKILTWIVAGVGITVALLVLIGLLAVFVAPLRGFFCVLLILLVIIPFIIYSMIRNYIRRTVGRLWWFM